MLIAAGNDELRLRDVLVGDVWVCSGQSNMEWVVADSADAAREIAATRDPGIRHLKVPRAWATAPRDELPACAWERADPEHVGGFTAVGYFFARELRRHVDVPIGLINASWGGSRIEPWMSAGSLKLDAAALAKLTAAESDYEREVMARLRARAGTLPDRDGGLVEGRAVWADPALDDASWMTIPVPTHWEDAGWEGMDGVAWYRTAFTLSAAEARAGVRLGLGTIDDSDIAWVNGREVGRTELAWNRAARLRRAGRGAARGPQRRRRAGRGHRRRRRDVRRTERCSSSRSASARRPLAGEWRFRLGVVSVNLDFHKSQVPTMLYNAMIHPLLRTPVKGVLWYQGESNASPEDAFVYRTLFADMIRDWRAGWGGGELPFLWVQLANFMAAQPEPSESSWAVLRESQSAALALPATGQAVAIDIGDAGDIHPRNKQEVGRRLALAARAVVYGEKIEHSGPTYRSHGSTRRADRRRARQHRRRAGRAGRRRAAACAASRSPAPTAASCGPTPPSRTAAWSCGATSSRRRLRCATPGPTTPTAPISTTAPACPPRRSAPTTGRRPGPGVAALAIRCLLFERMNGGGSSRALAARRGVD